MTSQITRRTATRTGISSVRTIIGETVLTAPARLCFIVEEKYEHDAMPSVVAQALRSWGHVVDVLRPHSTITDLADLMPGGKGAYDAYVLKTVSSGPGLSILEEAGAAGIATVNDYRAIRLARDKAVAASRARAAGLPFPTTWFAGNWQVAVGEVAPAQFEIRAFGIPKNVRCASSPVPATPSTPTSATENGTV